MSMIVYLNVSMLKSNNVDDEKLANGTLWKNMTEELNMILDRIWIFFYKLFIYRILLFLSEYRRIR